MNQTGTRPLRFSRRDKADVHLQIPEIRRSHLLVLPSKGHDRFRLSRNPSETGAEMILPWAEHPRGQGRPLPVWDLPQPTNIVGGDGPRRRRNAGPHDQAHPLRRQQEAVPGPARPDCRLRPLRGRVRDHAGRPDHQAPDLPDRRRLVRLQPSPTPRVRLGAATVETAGPRQRASQVIAQVGTRR